MRVRNDICWGLLSVALVLWLPACALLGDDRGRPDVASEVGKPVPVTPRADARPLGCAGYRRPVVARMTLPTQVVGGAALLAHETYVVLTPGYWQDAGQAGCATVPVEPR